MPTIIQKAQTLYQKRTIYLTEFKSEHVNSNNKLSNDKEIEAFYSYLLTKISYLPEILDAVLKDAALKEKYEKSSILKSILKFYANGQNKALPVSSAAESSSCTEQDKVKQMANLIFNARAFFHRQYMSEKKPGETFFSFLQSVCGEVDLNKVKDFVTTDSTLKQKYEKSTVLAGFLSTIFIPPAVNMLALPSPGPAARAAGGVLFPAPSVHVLATAAESSCTGQDKVKQVANLIFNSRAFFHRQYMSEKKPGETFFSFLQSVCGEVDLNKVKDFVTTDSTLKQKYEKSTVLAGFLSTIFIPPAVNMLALPSPSPAAKEAEAEPVSLIAPSVPKF